MFISLKKNILLLVSLFCFWLVLIMSLSAVTFLLKSHESETPNLKVNYWLDFAKKQCKYALPVNDSKAYLDQKNKLVIENINIHINLIHGNLPVSGVYETSLKDLVKPTCDFPLLKIRINAGQDKIIYTSTKTSVILALAFALMLMFIVNTGYYIYRSHLLFKQVNINLSALNKFSNPAKNLADFFNKNWWSFCLLIFLISRLYFFAEYSLLYHYLHYTDKFSDLMCHWDCYWYKAIIYNGYSKHAPNSEEANWAFFPLFPLIAKSMINAGFSYVSSAIIFNQILNLITVFILYDYLKRICSAQVANWGIIFFVFSPVTVYFFSPYTEALFMFLSIVTVNLIQRKLFLLAALTCTLLVSTRIVGIAMPLVLMYAYTKKYISNSGKKLSNAKFIIPLILLFILSIAGLLIYMLYLKQITGDFLAFYHVEKTWGRTEISGWLNPPLAIIRLLSRSSLSDLCFLVLTIWVSYYLYKSRLYKELIFFVGCSLLPIATQTLYSYSRYTLGIYSLYVCFGQVVQNRLFLKGVILLGLALTQLTYLFMWTSFSPGIQ